MGSDASFRDAEFLSNMTNTDLNDVTFSDSFDVDSLEKSKDAEDFVIENLLKEHDIKQIIQEDMTFLGDVEAPSGMFDQTIFNSTKLNKLTDIQRVGLLRPSTIIEEGSLIESETSRNNSRSIPKIILTKNDSATSETSQSSTAIQQDLTSAETTYKTCLPDSEVIEISEFTISSRDLETSSLSKTYKTAKTSQETQEIDESSEIVEISDSDSSLSPEVDYRRQRNTLEDVSSLIEDSSGYHDEPSSSIKDQQNESGIQEILDDSDPDQSISKMEFNDSLERMDYMMAKGARLLQKQSVMEVNTPTNNKTSIRDIMSNPITPSFLLSTPLIKPPRTPATTWNSNNKTYDLIEKTPTFKSNNSPNTPSTVMKQRNINSPPVVTLSNSKPRFERIKPTPTNSFKKPTLAPGSSRIPQKSSSTKKPNHYDYIVSPIGTYIKNSPYVPLHKNIKSHKSLFESDICNRTRETDDFRSSKENKKVFCDLPRKAYISSDLQHVRIFLIKLIFFYYLLFCIPGCR